MEVKIPCFNTFDTNAPFESIIQEINPALPKNEIGIINWPETVYKPRCSFQIAQLNNGIYLNYNVFEPKVLAEVTYDNGPVYNDSCVEFFFDPTGEGSYYNFEWNSKGIMLMGYGSSREGREQSTLENSLLVKRLARSRIKHSQSHQELTNWELFILIPFGAMFGHKIDSLRGKKCGGNFYKCGNKTEIPHYVTWNQIKTPRPDFHRPEGFGTLYFE